MGLAHLADTARVHHRAHQLAGGVVSHQPALLGRLDGIAQLGPDLLDQRGLDLDVEAGMGWVLVRKQLAQQVLER